MTSTHRRTGRPKGSTGPASCGTRSGYHAHRRRDEPACQPCLDANAGGRRSQRAVAQPRPGTGVPAVRMADDLAHRARLAVAALATDPADCRQLLDALGLMPTRQAGAA